MPTGSLAQLLHLDAALLTGRTRSESAGSPDRVALLVAGWVLRHGGAAPQSVFAADGSLVATAPLWAPPLRAVSDWRLSRQAITFTTWVDRWLSRQAGDDAPPAPRTVADVVFQHVLCERLAQHQRATRRALAAVDPLAPVLVPDLRADDRPDDWAPLAEAGWLVPFLRDALVRHWRAAETRVVALPPDEQMPALERWLAVIQRLQSHWSEPFRPELLRLLVSFYARWQTSRQAAGGLPALLGAHRPDDLPRAAIERLERAWGRLLEPALDLATLVAELRRSGWQRTAAEAHLLGAYARELEPVIEPIRWLHRDLCRII